MSPRRPTPTPEGFYNVKQATVKLGLATEDEKDTRGQRWLRDGCNRKPEDGKGKRFPHSRLNGQLVFSDTDLADIYAMHRSAPTRRGRPRSTRVAGESAIGPQTQTEAPARELQNVA